MKEEFIYYVWKNQRFAATDLSTTKGKAIELIYTGERNTHSGPDFLNVRLKIDGQEWIGNVEIHVRASDWKKHKHAKDEAYNNVILHVVYEADAEVGTHSGRIIPVLELQTILPATEYEKYIQLLASPHWLACSAQVKQIKPVYLTNWMARLLVERLEAKVQLLTTELELLRGNWDELFYRHVSRRFGMNVNAEPFQWLAMAAPYRSIARNRDSLIRTEALLFGQSGLLPEKQIDSYSQQLIREFELLQMRCQANPLPAHCWKLLRLRPGSFPTIRISQLANLLFREEHLFRRAMEITELAELRNLFRVSASDYWKTHYLFGRKSKLSTKWLGEEAIDSILINTVAPIRFFYGQMIGETSLQEEAVNLLEAMHAENNHLLRDWKSVGIKAYNASESQALIELRTNYCDWKRCADCAIGMQLIAA
jgi:Protein of unknown function (DUF2851)